MWFTLLEGPLDPNAVVEAALIRKQINCVVILVNDLPARFLRSIKISHRQSKKFRFVEKLRKRVHALPKTENFRITNF